MGAGHGWVVDEASEGFVVEDDGSAIGEGAEIAFDAVAAGKRGFEGWGGVFDSTRSSVMQAAMGDGAEECAVESWAILVCGGCDHDAILESGFSDDAPCANLIDVLFLADGCRGSPPARP